MGQNFEVSTLRDSRVTRIETKIPFSIFAISAGPKPPGENKIVKIMVPDKTAVAKFLVTV
jgi:hypothetical protein